MTVPTSKDYGKFYSERWNAAVQAGDYSEALDCGIKGYLIANDVQDDAHKLAFLGLIRFAIEELIGSPSVKPRKEGDAEKRCSFCGRKEDEVKLTAGAGAIICKISLVSDTFHNKISWFGSVLKFSSFAEQVRS